MMGSVLVLGIVLSFVPSLVKSYTTQPADARKIEKYRDVVLFAEKEMSRLQRAVSENRVDITQVERMTTKDWISTVGAALAPYSETNKRPDGGLEGIANDEINIVRSGSIEGGDYAITVFLTTGEMSKPESTEKTILSWTN